MEFCCETMNNYLNEEDRGFFVRQKENGLIFLYFSSVNKSNLEALLTVLRKDRGKHDFQISIVGEVGIKFCPWCGSKLEQMV